jgi:hypothetical protein
MQLKEWRRSFGVLSTKSRRTLLLLAAIAAFAFFVKISIDVGDHEDLERYDRRILVFISEHRVTAFNAAIVDLSAMGSPAVIVLTTLIGLAILWLDGAVGQAGS